MSTTERMSTRSKTDSLKRGEEGNGEPRAQWSTQSYSLEDMVASFPLPQVVKCSPQALMLKRQTPLPVNLGQPMLLFDTRTVRKLLARNVLFDKVAQRYAETDETVVIPADYEGNFIRLQLRTAKDNAVHPNVERVANAGAPGFINMTPITAFKMGSNPSSNDYPRLDYTSGNVFLIDKVVRSTSKRAGSSRRREGHYLKCRDERETEVLIPMSQPGEFVEILPNPYGKGRLSMPSSDIIATQKFPNVVRYVHGGTRPRLTSFSGLLTLLDSFEETSVVGCVLDGRSFTLIELPLSSPLFFQIALNSGDLFGLPLLKNALKVCESKGSAFARDLKFKFKFALKVLETGHEPLTNGDSMPPSASNSAKLGVSQTYLYL